MDDGHHRQQQVLYDMVEKHRANPSHHMITNQMIWDFELIPREQTENDVQSLRSPTYWRRSGYAIQKCQSWRPWLILISTNSNFNVDGVPLEAFQHPIFCSDPPCWGPTGTFIDISEPRAILIMRHDVQPEGEESLRGGCDYCGSHGNWLGQARLKWICMHSSKLFILNFPSCLSPFSFLISVLI